MNTQAPGTTKPTGEAAARDGASARPAVTFARRGDLEDFLAHHGVARGAARRIAAGGWPALRKMAPMDAAFADLRAALESLPQARLDEQEQP